MFEIGFSELVLVGIVALLVVGPERLPELVRTVGHWVGRFRRMADEVNAEVQREMHNAEVLRRETEKLQQQLNQDALEKLASPHPETPPGERETHNAEVLRRETEKLQQQRNQDALEKFASPPAETHPGARKDKTSDPS
ncbi:MAG: Sec-independent protein translocase protein TatB [Pseudomonadota bacterium]